MSQQNEVLVRVNGVSKKFCRDLKKSLWYGVKDVASELLPFGRRKSGIKGQGANHSSLTPDSCLLSPDSSSSSLTSDLRHPTSDPDLRPGEFWANKDISFELRRGECIGLIGRNGAGKTTLLKMLNGLIKPDSGTIEMRGRVGALIALGAGFNPILTGRENIYVNGSILGLTKEEIDNKIEEIIDFSEVREFIDSPVQSYSSGMQVRLGFAVATAMDPDVLILDEVLAVGDASFRNKCYKRVIALRKKAAVIFVSHNMEQVGRICDSALLLSKGKVSYLGDIGGGISAYEDANDDNAEEGECFLSFEPPISEFAINNLPTNLLSASPLSFEIHIKSSSSLSGFFVRILFYNVSGGVSAECNSITSDHPSGLLPGTNNWNVEVTQLPLKNGKYRMGFGLIDSKGELLVWSHKQHSLVIHGAHHTSSADCQLKANYISDVSTSDNNSRLTA